MNYDIVAIDADGTLLGENLAIPCENIEAVKAAAAKGIKIVICSGRGLSSLSKMAEKLGLISPGNYIIAFNGCAVYETGKEQPLREVLLDKNLAVEVLERGRDFEVDPIVYKDSCHIYVKSDSPNVQGYTDSSQSVALLCGSIEEKILSEGKDVNKVLFVGEWEELRRLYNKIADTMGDRCNVFFSARNLLEVINKTADKGEGLKWLCARLNIPLSRSAAIGDNYNDVSMIKAAGLGAAMANGEAEVRLAADYVTRKNNVEGGVAEFLYQYIL